jgi:hypothetical protein
MFQENRGCIGISALIIAVIAAGASLMVVPEVRWGLQLPTEPAGRIERNRTALSRKADTSRITSADKLRKALLGQWETSGAIWEFQKDGKVLVVNGLDQGYRIVDRQRIELWFFHRRLDGRIWTVTLAGDQLQIRKRSKLGMGDTVFSFRRR